jgi:hypothetical protein
MKQFILLLSVLAVCLIDFSGCRKKDDNPIGPDTTAVGTSFVSGYVSFSAFVNNTGFKKYTGTLDLSGVTVQIINTSIRTLTDAKGYWELPNLDSGVYIIQFTKKGYDTAFVENLAVKNHDTIYIGKTPARWFGVQLNEIIIGTIINTVAQIEKTVKIIDMIDSTRFDTNYRLINSFEIQFSGEEQNIRDKNPDYPYDICYTINNSPTVDMSKFPIASNTLLQDFRADHSVWDFMINDNSNMISRNGRYSITEFLGSPLIYDYSEKSKGQLYLHIVPIWLQWHRESIQSGVVESHKRGNVVSIPIEWK